MTPQKLPELVALERIIELGAGWIESRQVCEVSVPDGSSYPVYVITLGNPAPEVPAVGYFGGVHGLERIGSGVVIVRSRAATSRASASISRSSAFTSYRRALKGPLRRSGAWPR